jgi:N-acetylglutamate synthase-like GNAT family acetyltransferase
MIIRKARGEERSQLVELMRRASLVWDDTRANLVAHPELIDIPAEQIAAGRVIVAEAGSLSGFAAILPRHDGNVELDGLFVEPAMFGNGIGRALVVAVVDEARELRARSVHVVANQNVLGFYQAVGFRPLGEIATPLGPMATLMVRDIAS